MYEKTIELFQKYREQAPMYAHAEYLQYMVRKEFLRTMVDKAADFLRGKDFDALAFSGTSGLLLGTPLSLALDIPMIVVRKAGDRSHSGHICEGFRAAKKYVIVDDFVDSGATIDRIREQISIWAPEADLVGVLEGSRMLEDVDNWFHSKFPWGRRH